VHARRNAVSCETTPPSELALATTVVEAQAHAARVAMVAVGEARGVMPAPVVPVAPAPVAADEAAMRVVVLGRCVATVDAMPADEAAMRAVVRVQCAATTVGMLVEDAVNGAAAQAVAASVPVVHEAAVPAVDAATAAVAVPVAAW